MRTADGNLRPVSIRNRHTLAHDPRRLGGIPLMLSERGYPRNDRCTRSAHAAPRASPAPLAAVLFPFSSSSTFSFARWWLTRALEGALFHAHIDPLPFPVRDKNLKYPHLRTGTSTGTRALRVRVRILMM
jgi:hypothetical protein